MKLKRLPTLYRPWTPEDLAILPVYLNDMARLVLTQIASPYLAQYIADQVEQIRKDVRNTDDDQTLANQTHRQYKFNESVRYFLNNVLLEGDGMPLGVLDTNKFQEFGGFEK